MQLNQLQISVPDHQTTNEYFQYSYTHQSFTMSCSLEWIISRKLLLNTCLFQKLHQLNNRLRQLGSIQVEDYSLSQKDKCCYASKASTAINELSCNVQLSSTQYIKEIFLKYYIFSFFNFFFTKKKKDALFISKQ